MYLVIPPHLPTHTHTHTHTPIKEKRGHEIERVQEQVHSRVCKKEKEEENYLTMP